MTDISQKKDIQMASKYLKKDGNIFIVHIKVIFHIKTYNYITIHPPEWLLLVTDNS